MSPSQQLPFLFLLLFLLSLSLSPSRCRRAAAVCAVRFVRAARPAVLWIPCLLHRASPLATSKRRERGEVAAQESPRGIAGIAG